ncbi:hypothetical protein HIM_02259 [Hirsutella minnesotensis 3608]|nr:hypothetical protein HIM_02259 [Hirsutella minnesotensis 3608]
MFGLLTADSRGSELPSWTAKLATPHQVHAPSTANSFGAPTRTILASKRSRESSDGPDPLADAVSPAKRIKTGAPTQSRPASPPVKTEPTTTPSDRNQLEDARDTIRHQFGLEVLLKHNELRLINQELAKCQVALEQLRRCHLIPYPQNCPTPQQMLDISSGKGPALAKTPGESTPRWAPPFGVVDGPYARHYAKWLIPDPAFDGVQPEWQLTLDHCRARPSVCEGRTTRNSFAEPPFVAKSRSARGSVGQKLQALSSGYPQAKDKAGPCILKRADGKTVKLVCIDCNRENFSSTQGFINHCRIAHKRDFKSHEEAAVQSGHPIDVVANPPTPPVEEKSPPTPSNAVVHPFARQDMTDQQAYTALRSRISDSLKLYHAGKLPGVHGIPGAGNARKTSTAKCAKANAVPETPHLSRLLEGRKFGGNLHDLVTDAKTRISLEDLTPDEESDDASSPSCSVPPRGNANVRTPGVMRVPARGGLPLESPPPASRPSSSKSRLPDVPLVTSSDHVMRLEAPRILMSDEDVDMEDANLSPSTLISNNAPSLVSDDGEYDDSDEGSSVSGGSDHLDGTPMSDLADFGLDDEHEPRALRRASSGAAGTVKLRKDDTKHVTFMNTLKSSAKRARPGLNL